MAARLRPVLAASLGSLRSARLARPARLSARAASHETDALLLCVYSILYDYYVVRYIFGATTTHPGPPGRGASAPLRSHMVLMMFAL